MTSQTLTPAEIAAQNAQKEIIQALTQEKSFLLEAGAGAGKTYSLIFALQYLLEKYGLELTKKKQRIACITYTNVARDEIEARTDRNPLVFSSTIHSFCWAIIKDFQLNLRQALSTMPNWSELLDQTGGIGSRVIEYDLGYPSIEKDCIMLGHDDIPRLAVTLLESPKFRDILGSKFPFIFVDEYQDTDKEFATSLTKFFIAENTKITLGFFGDHWQKIYPSGCGKIDHPDLLNIGKRANFRSSSRIVNSLNQLRPELTQEPSDPKEAGKIDIFHTNLWQVQRRTGGHWADDLYPEDAHKALCMVQKILCNEGWEFSTEKTKILMLTHNLLADEQGYKNLADVFSRNESFIKKEDPTIEYLVDFLEPLCDAYEKKRYGEFFLYLNRQKNGIQSQSQKNEISDELNKLLEIRKSETIGSVIDYLKTTKWVKLSEKVQKKELSLAPTFVVEDEKVARRVERQKRLREIPYNELRALADFINNKTPFSTKHGVKGAEFENVLVVLGRGWNHYNFGQFLEWMGSKIPPGKEENFIRNRNLFYVTCSRPKMRLALLFTQKIPALGIAALGRVFGNQSLREL